MTADEIHQLGLAEVKRIHAEMDKIRVATGFQGDQPAFFEFMRTDKQFYLPDTDEGRAQYLKPRRGLSRRDVQEAAGIFRPLAESPADRETR
jgi:uncharacterized protein (DUF885 family)